MKHILVIEDDLLVRNEIVILLKKAGYQVDEITDFKETTQQVMQYDVDFILLDLNLPCESGFQICKNLKAKESTPILVLTSRDRLNDEIHVLKLGADD